MGMHLLSWISFKHLCLKFCHIIILIATQAGELLETGKINEIVRDSSLCVALDVDQAGL